MGKQRIIIGTRGSKLALWQANHIANAILTGTLKAKNITVFADNDGNILGYDESHIPSVPESSK